MRRPQGILSLGKLLLSIGSGVITSYLWCNSIAPRLFIRSLECAAITPLFFCDEEIRLANYYYLSGANIQSWLRPDLGEVASPRRMFDPKKWNVEFVRSWLVFRSPKTSISSENVQKSRVLTNALVATIAGYWNPASYAPIKLELVETVISWGVDVNRPGMYELTPFHAAMCFDRVEVLGILIRYGLIIESEQLFDGAECAVMNGSKRTVTWLLDQDLWPQGVVQKEQAMLSGHVYEAIPGNSNLLHVACKFKQKEMYKLLLERTDLDPLTLNDAGMTAQELCRRE